MVGFVRRLIQMNTHLKMRLPVSAMSMEFVLLGMALPGCRMLQGPRL
jgi:hypothetical protein